jgi:hypothetical protein
MLTLYGMKFSEMRFEEGVKGQRMGKINAG